MLLLYFLFQNFGCKGTEKISFTQINLEEIHLFLHINTLFVQEKALFL